MIIITFFTLIMQSNHQLCTKDLDQEFQLSIPNTFLRITYQLAQQERINITNKTLIEITSTYNEIITFSYFNNSFQIFSNNQLIQNLILSPGQYMIHEILCREFFTNICKFQTKVYQSNEIQFKICLDQDFIQHKYQEFQQQHYLAYHLIQNLDNKFFHTSLWIKEIVQGNLPIQIIFRQPQGCIFVFNFKIKKILFCSINVQKEVLIQESMLQNYWFYFEFNQFLDKQEFDNFLILGQFIIERIQNFQTQIYYSFQNQIKLNYPNSIISKFIIKQQFLQEENLNICMPDCKLCNSNGQCLECMNGLKLVTGMCHCQRDDFVSNWDGICQYPANLLKLKELETNFKCQFGFYFSDIIQDCIQCPYEENFPSISCLQRLSQDQFNVQISQKMDFEIKFQNELSKLIQKYKCPKNCLSCTIKNKIIQCTLCRQGYLDQKSLCQICKIQHCQYCLNFTVNACFICLESYSLNYFSQCIKSKEYQFDKLISYLKQQHTSGEENCQIYDSQECKLCSQGYSRNQNGLCVKYQQLNIIFDSSSIFIKYPLIALGIYQNNKLYFKNLELLNLQKIYFESSIKSNIQIDQQLNEHFLPSYYSQDLNSNSFCKKFNNCENFFELEVVIQVLVSGICLEFENILFYDVNSILKGLQLYDISPRYIVINIHADSQQFIEINQLTQLIKLDSQSKLNVKLNYYGGHIINDKNNKGQLNILSPQTIQFEDVDIINDFEQLIIQFDNDEVVLSNVQFQGNISILFKNQTKVIIQSLKLSNNYINTDFIFKFTSENVQVLLDSINMNRLHISNTKVLLIQSGITSFVLKNSTFHNIILQNSSLISYGLNISQFYLQGQLKYQSSFIFDDLEFNQLTFVHSLLIQQQTEHLFKENQVIIQNNRISQCKLLNSILYLFVGQIYKIFQVDTIIIAQILSENSNFFEINFQLENKLNFTNISLISCAIKDNFFILIHAASLVIIKDLFIDQLVLTSKNSTIIYIKTKNIQLINFQLINHLGKIRAKSLMQITASNIQINDTLIYSSSFNLINLQKGILLQSSSNIEITNMNISKLSYLGSSFLSIQMLDECMLSVNCLYIHATYLSSQYSDEENDIQTLIEIISYKNYSAYFKDIYMLLIYQESQYISRSVIYSKGYSFIRLSNLTLNIDNNGSVPNQLIYIEGNILEIFDIKISFFSHKQIQNLNHQQNYIFSIFGITLNLQFINLYIKDQQIGIFQLIRNLFKGDKIFVNNVNLISGSYIDSFFLAPFGNHKFIYFSNFRIFSSISSFNIIVFFTNTQARLMIKNLTLIQQNQRNIQALVIYGNYTIQANLVSIYITKNISSETQGTSDIRYFLIVARYLNIQNFIVKQLDQSPFGIYSLKVAINNLMIDKVISLLEIVSINASSHIIICNALIQYSQSSMSIISINQLQLKHQQKRDLQFKQNNVANGHLIIYNMEKLQQFKYHYNIRDLQIKIAFYNILSIQNICKICYKFINNINFNTGLQIKGIFEINSQSNQIFYFQNFSSQIQHSFIQNNSSQFEQFILSSNKQVLFNDSYIIFIGEITQSADQNFIYYRKSIVSINYIQDDTLKQNQNIIPTLLKLSINKLTQDIKLSGRTFSENFKQFSISNFIYFPSGRVLNSYKILKLDKKQYLEYIDYIYIYGYNEYNNIKLQINKCDLATDNDNIIMVPNHINSTLLLSEIVFIGNPYSIGNFTLQIDCRYEQLQLQLVIPAKLFKCQLGEILQVNKCKQCDIQYNLYSVRKHSLVCKLVDYDKIEDVQIGLIKIRQGYWRPYFSNDQIEHCRSNNCLGGWDVGQNSCVQAYIGPLCTECDNNNIRGHGYYSRYRQECFECKYGLDYIYNIVYLVIASLITLTITTRSQYQVCQRYQMLMCSNKFYQMLNRLQIDQLSVLIKQIQNYFFYLQFVNIIFDVDLDLGLIVNTVSNPIQILNPQYDCIISWFDFNQQITKIIMQIITPICILIIFYTIVIAINRFVRLKYLYIFIYTPILQSFVIYSIVICQSAISHLTYIQISGIKWIYGARQLQYFESNNKYLFIALAIVILIFAVIIPFNFVLLLHKKQHILQTNVIIIKIGYLYQEYKNNKYYWEFFKLTTKIIYISFTLVFINYFTISVPISTFYIVCIVQLLKFLKPYYLKNLNRQDQQFHSLLVIDLLMIGIIQQVEQIIFINIWIIIMYSINAIFFFRIIKIIIIKTYYNNPQIVDKIRQKVMNYKGKSLVEKKMQIIHKYSLLKLYSKSQTKQIKDINYPKNDQNTVHSPIVVLSNIISNQEIELASFK